jgi:hypothetical protein
MTTPNLAKIERVDLREAWPNEAQHFTPWLAENLSALGEALGMDLELQETEASVGGYSLDLLATDLNGTRPVIIENQLEATNHTHLGQLLTYAAGYDANVIVWLTQEFRDEHRQALDWLNQRTGEDTQFFGVVVELWRIGDSLPAPHFNLVATPNDWRKKTISRVRGEAAVLSKQDEHYQDFFRSLFDTLRQQNFAVPRNIPRRSANFQAYSRRVLYSVNFASGTQARVEVYLYADSDWNIWLLENLERYKDEIESELGPLNWQRMRKECRISLDRPGSIEDDADTLAEIKDWMVKNLLKFKRVFDPKLAELIEEQSPTPEQETID